MISRFRKVRNHRDDSGSMGPARMTTEILTGGNFTLIVVGPFGCRHGVFLEFLQILYQNKTTEIQILAAPKAG